LAAVSTLAYIYTETGPRDAAQQSLKDRCLEMTSADTTSFVYVGNSDSQNISVFKLQADGGLEPVETVAVPGPDKPGGSLPMAVSPDKTRLFVGLRNEPYSVVTFAIDATSGKLTRIGSGPLADSMCCIAPDRTGRFLLAASYGGNKVTVSPIGADGVVGETRQTVATEPNAHCVIVDPTNCFVLNSSLGGEVVHMHRFDADTGRLSPNAPATVPVQAKSGPRHLVFSPDRGFVYLLNELSATIDVFPYDAASGTLHAPTQTIGALPADFAGTPWAADIHLTPDGRFLYASERTTSTLAAFRVDSASGALTAIASYPTEKQPRAFAIDPSGRFLVSVGQLSDRLSIHTIDRDSGTLRRLKDYPVGKNPNWVEIVSLR
jgi:6-phosphogluconolactonase